MKVRPFKDTNFASRNLGNRKEEKGKSDLPVFDWEQLRGKRVALVGNAVPAGDCSREIDSHEIVIRLNHAYNLASGRVGMKTTHVCQTFSGAWRKLTAEERERIFQPRINTNYHELNGNENSCEIRENSWEKPIGIIVKHPERYSNWSDARAFCEKYFAGTYSAGTIIDGNMTTGTCVARILRERGIAFDAYGFSAGEEFHEYLQREGRHYLRQEAAESRERETLKISHQGHQGAKGASLMQRAD